MSVEVAGDCDHTCAAVDKNKKRIRFVPEIPLKPPVSKPAPAYTALDQTSTDAEYVYSNSELPAKVEGYAVVEKTTATSRRPVIPPVSHSACTYTALDQTSTDAENVYSNSELPAKVEGYAVDKTTATSRNPVIPSVSHSAGTYTALDQTSTDAENVYSNSELPAKVEGYAVDKTTATSRNPVIPPVSHSAGTYTALDQTRTDAENAYSNSELPAKVKGYAVVDKTTATSRNPVIPPVSHSAGTYTALDQTSTYAENAYSNSELPAKVERYAVVDKTTATSRNPVIPPVYHSAGTYAALDATTLDAEGFYSSNKISASVKDSVSSSPTVDKTTRSRIPERSPPKEQESGPISKTENSKKKSTPKTKKCGIILIAVLVASALFIAVGVALIVAFLEISQLRSEVIALESTFDTPETCATNSSNTLAADVFRILQEAGHAFPSCAAVRKLSSSSPSGNYHIRSSNGSAIDVYCDMTRTCGGITGGWMRVAELDMRDNTTQCPSSLELVTSPRRTCRIIDRSSALCSSDTFSVGGIGYSKVCGRIRAYQVGTPDAFGYSSLSPDSGRETNPNIETYFVDGVSLTYGMSPRQHIWTFAGAVNEDDLRPTNICPCINTAISSIVTAIPSFVGEDYFCDTAPATGIDKIFHADDALWDGAGCGPQNTCCSINSPPWFYKQLPQPTTDDIEMRVCRDQSRSDEDIAIEVVEIYVQ